MRLFASASNGRKNGRTSSTVNNNNRVEKQAQKDSPSPIKPNFTNEQPKPQSTNKIIYQSAPKTTIPEDPVKDSEKNTQNEKPNFGAENWGERTVKDIFQS